MDEVSAISGFHIAAEGGRYGQVGGHNSVILGSSHSHSHSHSPTSHQSKPKKAHMNDLSNVKARYLMTADELTAANMVTPEMKRRVQEESARIMEKMAQSTIAIQKKEREEHYIKVAEKKKHAEVQFQKWGDLIKNSPFHIDYNLLHEKQIGYMREKDQEARLRRKQAGLLRNMTGLPQHDIQDRDITTNTIKDMKSKLALQYRATKLSHYTLLSEKETMDQMVMSECEGIIRKFPTVGLKLAFESNNYLNGQGGSVSGSPSNRGNTDVDKDIVGGGKNLITPTANSIDDLIREKIQSVAVGKRRYDANRIQEMKSARDNVNYIGDGRYDVSGNIVEVSKLKTTNGMHRLFE